jgi:hypothetical protein
MSETRASRGWRYPKDTATPMNNNAPTDAKMRDNVLLKKLVTSMFIKIFENNFRMNEYYCRYVTY